MSRIPFSLCRYNELGPYTTVVGHIVGERAGQCIVEIPNNRALLVDAQCIPGSKVVAYIIRAALRSNELPILRPGIAVLSDTLALIDDGRSRVSFSEHIRSAERRAELMILAQNVTREGVSVRWRSSAKSASLDALSQDLESCKRKLQELRKKVQEVTEPSVVSYGEAIALIKLTRPSKEYLDDVRAQVLGTVPYHHTLKTCQYPQEAVDVLDFVSNYVNKHEMRKAIEKYMQSEVVKLSSLRLKHSKPDGEEITIGPIHIEKLVEVPLLGTVIVGKRIARSSGIYDGLEVTKERGDVITTIIPTDRWFLIHVYADSSGKEKGMYININTPPELCAPLSEVRYMDLYIDIAVVGDDVRVIDEDQLRSAVKRGIVDGDLEYMAIESVKWVLTNMKEIIEIARRIVLPSPPSPQLSAPSSQ